MKRLLIASAAILILMAGAIMVAPGFINWSQYRSSVTGLLHNLTGYDYTIDGSLNVRLLPRPHLVIHDLSAAAAPGTKGPLLALGRADIDIAFFPLFSGRLVLRSIALEKPELRLEIATNGNASWMTTGARSKFDQLQTHPPTGNSGNFNSSIAIHGLSVSEGEIMIIDHRNDTSRTLDHVNFTTQADGAAGIYAADGTFLYNRQPVTFNFMGKSDGKTGTLSTTAKFNLPTLHAGSSLAGAITMRGDLAFQGEADFNTPNLQIFLSWLNGKTVSPSLAQAFNAKGMLTADSAQFSYKDGHFMFGVLPFSGRVSISGLNQQKQAMQADISLIAGKPVDLTAMTGLTPQPSAPDKTIGNAAFFAPEFIPKTLQLPVNIDATIALSAPAVTFQKFSATNVTGNFVLKDHQLSGKAAGVLAGNGVINAVLGLSGSLASAPDHSLLTIVNPQINYNLNLKTTNGAQIIAPFFAGNPNFKLPPAAQGGWNLNAIGAIKPNAVQVTQGSLASSQNTINFLGAYTASGVSARKALTATLSADHLDFDQWFGAPAPQAASAVPAGITPALNTAALQNSFLTKLSLPFDLELSAAAKTARFKGLDYDHVNLLATLIGRQLNIKTFEASDRQGGSLLAAGTIGDTQTLKDVDVSVQGKTANLKKLIVGFMPAKADLPDSLADAEVVAELKGQPNSLNFTANVKAMGGSLDLAGALADALNKPNVTALTLRLQHPNYVDVMRIFNPAFHSGVAIRKSLDLFVTLSQAKGLYTFKGAQGTVGPATFTGDMTIDTAKPTPQIIVTKLQLGNVPLDQLLGRDAVSQAAMQQRQTLAAPTGAEHWSRTPFQDAWLRQYNVALDATAQSISYGAWQLNNADIAVTLHDGVLSINKLDGGLYGGYAVLAAQIAASDKPGGPLTAVGKMGLQNVDLPAFIAAFTGSTQLRGKGNLSLEANLQSGGISMADVAGNLSGVGKLTGKDITLGGIDLSRLSQMLAQPPLGGRIDLSALTGGTSSFAKLDCAFGIKQGVLVLSPLQLSGTAGNIAAPSTINLPLWTIDMESTITLENPKDVPPFKLTFRGPLDQPVKNFGDNALFTYAGGRLQSALTSMLQHNGLTTPPAPAATATSTSAPAIVTKTPGSPSVKTMATPLIAPQSTMLPAVANTAPAASGASSAAPAAPTVNPAPATTPPATIPTPITPQPSAMPPPPTTGSSGAL